MKVIDMLKDKCYTMLENTIDEKQIKILGLVSKILHSTSSLKKLDVQVVLNILIDLGYSKEEIPQIYSNILKEID